MACFQLVTRAPSTSRVVAIPFCFFARLSALLSSMLQIINHRVLTADSSLVNCIRLRVAFRNSLLRDSIEFVGQTHLSRFGWELQERNEPIPGVFPDFH